MSKLYSSYQRLAKIYSQKSGIDLLVRGSSFFTDGKKITIADIPDVLNKRLKDPALAGLVHESLHVKHSIFRKKNKFNTEDEKEVRSKFNGLLNNVEDIRILSLGKEEYLGMPDLQKTGLSFIKKLLIKAISLKKIDIQTLLGVCIQYKKSGEDTSFMPDTVNQMAEKTRSIWDSVDWKPYKEGHDQALQITKKILKTLKQEQEQLKKEKEDEKDEKDENRNNKRETEGNEENDQEDEEKSEAKEDDGDGDDTGDKEESKESEEGNESDGEDDKECGKGNGDLDDDEEEDNDDEYDEYNEDEDEDNRVESEDGSANNEEDGDKGENEDDSDENEEDEEGDRGKIDGEDLKKDLDNLLKGKNEESSFEEGVFKAMEKVLTEEVESWHSENEKHIPHPEIIPFDIEEHIFNPWKTEDSSEISRLEKEFKKLSSSIDEETKKLKARVLPLLMAKKKTSFLYEQDNGTIDDSKLYKLLKGDGKIYKQKVLGRSLNTVVTILNDISGSMAWSKIDMLRPTLLVIADTLFALKVPFEILAFSTVDYSYKWDKILREKEKAISREESYLYNRVEPLMHIIIKEFNENYYNVRKLLSLMVATNNNIDNESIVWAARRLIERQEERKILFVLSDGLPNGSYTDCKLLGKDLKEKVSQIEKSGIEVVGIGLKTNAPRSFYPTCACIENINQISIEVYRVLAQKLMN